MTSEKARSQALIGEIKEIVRTRVHQSSAGPEINAKFAELQAMLAEESAETARRLIRLNWGILFLTLGLLLFTILLVAMEVIRQP